MGKIKEAVLTIYFLARLPFILALRLLFKPRARPPEKVRKILVVRLDRMGDFILSLPVIDNLRAAYPEARIDVLVRPYLKELALLVKAIDNMVTFDGLLSTIRKIRREKYDIAMDMLYDYKIRSALLTFFTGAPIRIGFKGGYRELLFTGSVERALEAKEDMISTNLKLLEKLDVEPRVEVPRLVVESVEGAAKATIAIHPGAYYESQKWGWEKFAAVGKKIIGSYGVTLLVIGGPDDKDTVNRIIQKIDDRSARAVFPSAGELASLLSACRLLACNNSGPLHLAAALGVPTVSIMGPTDPVLWHPKGKDNIVIRKDLPCSPCGRAKCSRHDCMELITVGEVMVAIDSLMTKKKEGA